MIALDPIRNVYLDQDTGKQYPRISNIFEATGLIDTRWFKEWHATRGTYVHQATQLFDEGRLDSHRIEEEEWGHYYAGWPLFIKEIKPQIIFSELPLVHRALKYGCTLDRVVEINGRWGVLDIKTGTVPGHVGQQTLAHKLAFNFSMPFGKRVTDRWCLLLPGQGKYKLMPLNRADDLVNFMKTLQDYQKGISRG